MELFHLNIDDLNKKITKIFNSVGILKDNIEKMQKKMIDIKKVFIRFKDNKTLTLHQTNSYLKFQMELLENEKRYHENMKNIILDKMSKEMLEIYNYIIMILTSLENLEIEHDEDKHNLINKIITFKKVDQIDCSSIIQLINATVNNLELIYQFIQLFGEYIDQTTKRNSLENIHCNSFSSTLANKKNHISLEYMKYCDQITELIDYFLLCSDSIDKQMSQQQIINFLVEKNKIEN